MTSSSFRLIQRHIGPKQQSRTIRQQCHDMMRKIGNNYHEKTGLNLLNIKKIQNRIKFWKTTSNRHTSIVHFKLLTNYFLDQNWKRFSQDDCGGRPGVGKMSQKSVRKIGNDFITRRSFNNASYLSKYAINTFQIHNSSLQAVSQLNIGQ